MIEAAQRVLRALGYNISADGIAGSATAAAVRAFQGAANREHPELFRLAVDGVIGPQTRSALGWYASRGYFDAPASWSAHQVASSIVLLTGGTVAPPVVIDVGALEGFVPRRF